MTTKRDPRPRCELCGEPIKPNGEMAEMYDPTVPYDPAVGEDATICHAECGLARGMEIA